MHIIKVFKLKISDALVTFIKKLWIEIGYLKHCWIGTFWAAKFSELCVINYTNFYKYVYKI